jgi:hypothetical protein
MNRKRAMCFVALGACVLTARSAAADAISLMWDPSAQQVSGYAVYVGTQSGSYTQRIDVGGATAYTFAQANAGQRYCFAVASYLDTLEGQKSTEVCGYSNAPPSLVNPGNQSSNVGQPVNLQLVGSDPALQPLSYSATGLPPGLNVMSSTGLISGSGTTSGTYTVTARAFDGVLSASQSFSWTMVAAPLPDTMAPAVTISGPTSSATFTTTSSNVALSGTSTDNVSVSQVSWINDRGGAGSASGNASWSTPSIALVGGANVITVMARDAAGNEGRDVLTVTYNPPVTTPPPPPPPPASVLLFGEVLRGTKWRKQVRLTWTQAPWSSVWVYRNGSRIAKTSNDGTFIDTTRGATSYSYRICAPFATSCSNTITVYF